MASMMVIIGYAMFRHMYGAMQLFAMPCICQLEYD